MRFTKLPITALALMLSCHVFAQDCNWKESKKDPITDQKFLKSKEIAFMGDQKFGASDKKQINTHIELSGGKVILYCDFMRTVLMSDEKVVAPKLMIRLEDKTVIELNSEEVFSTSLQPMLTEVKLRFEMPADKARAMAKSPMTAMRLSFSGQDFLFEAKEKKADNLQRQFNCLISEM